MKSVNKIILAGLAALWTACSNDASVDSDLSGATTEPNSSKTAELTEEQKAILNKSFYSLVDKQKAKVVLNNDSDSLIEVIIDQPTLVIDSETIEVLKLMFPFSTKSDTGFYYRSRDNRWTCHTYSFPQESGALMELKYDARAFSVGGSGQFYAGTFATRIVEVDSVPVIMKTVGGANYWGYGVSCAEFLEEFKDSCSASNGIFKDFGDGCNSLGLNLACSMLVPEGMNVDDMAKSNTEQYLNECKEDSVRYEPYINEDFGLYGCEDQSGSDNDGIEYYRGTCYPIDADPSLDSLSKEWQKGVTRTFKAYSEQFEVFDRINDGHMESHVHPDLVFGDSRTYSKFVSYNTFPSDVSEELQEVYRKEGVYHLPDSLLGVFFPKVAESPTAFKVLERDNETYYMIVLKDVGAKGHVLRNIGDYGIRITDVVKSGDACPEDTAIYYSAYLVRGAVDWDILEKEITRKTHVSTAWSCDDPESLERIEPYGEWVYPYGVI